MKLKIYQIIIIALLAAYMIFAVIMLFVVSNKDYVDELEQMMWVASILGAIMLIVGTGLKAKLNDRPVTLMRPNGQKPYALGSFMRIGNSILGGFRFREIEGTWVSYTFFLFLIPLFPTGCYRVRLIASEYNGVSNKTEWAIYGSEKSNALEISTIYLIIYGVFIWFICMMLAIGMTFI